MANIIKPKRSNTAGLTPTTSNLASGEMGVNMADQKMYINNGTSVVQIGAGNLSGLGDVTITSPSNGQSLQFNGTEWVNGSGGSGDVQGPASSTDNALVRFDSTTGKVIQNGIVTQDDNGTLANVNAISFDTTPTSAPTTQGSMAWDSGNGTPSIVLNNDVSLQLGQEQLALVYNGTGSTITNGSVVAVTGAQGQRPSVSLADADSESTSANTLGIATQDIANGAEGFITTFGFVRGINTSAFTAGQAIYLSQTAGQFTATRPSAPAHTVALGWVIKVNASSGEVFVNINNGWELDELHNVLITSPTSGNTLIYDAVSGVWENANISAGTGISVTNGAGSISIANTGVTSVSGTAPIASSGGATPTISISQASSTTNGYLSSTDWNTFNNKGTGTVTSVATGTGLSGGTITSSGTISLANTSVTAGSYTNANITVDAQGRITTASNGTAGGVTSIAGTANEIDVSASTGAVTISLPATINANLNGNASTATTATNAGNADTLDGQHGSYYQPASTAITTSNIGSQSVNYATSAGSASSATNATNATNSTNATLSVIQDTRASALTPDAYTDYRATYEFTNQVVSGWNTAITMQGWHNGYSAWQIWGPSDTSPTENWYLRSGVNTSWNPLRTIIHSGNIGSQSVNYANTAGNTSSISSAVGGTYTWTGNQYFQSNLGGYSGSLSSPPLQAYSTSNNSAFMSFHKAGIYAVNMGLDADNVLRIGGWSAGSNRWQLDMSGNQYLAGMSYANWDTSGRNYNREWIEMPNYTGLYSPNNSAHFYPNDGTYGSWRIQGSRNGWGGIEFVNGSNGAVVLMNSNSSNESGFHNNSYGWQFRWYQGTLYCHKNTYGGGTSAVVLDSSNYSSYVSGGQYFGTATTKAISYNANSISENITVTAGNNGLSAGPITINTGYTVTVQTGANWVIV